MAGLDVYLTGAFRIQSDSGTDLTPNGAKECGLVALLALSPGKKRTRTWLQSKLWSDRGREQAAASLRQALTQIRKRLGENHAILAADRRYVWLDESNVRCVELPGYEFLEGLDVRDDEFEHWLSAERSARVDASDRFPARHHNIAPEPRATRDICSLVHPRYIQVRLSPNRSSESWWAERLVADVIARSLSEDYSFPIINEELSGEAAVGWRVDVDGMSSGDGKFILRVGLTDDQIGYQIWSSHRVIENFGSFAVDNPEILQIAHELSSTISSKIILEARSSRLPEDPDVYCAAAIRKLFSMRAEDMEQADQLFARAAEMRPRGSYWAWRSQLREMQFMQRFRTDRRSLEEECEQLMRKAIELEPESSIVLALLANTRLYIGRDSLGSLELASRSVRINPGNPMAWWAFSAAQLARGALEEARRAAQMTHHLTRSSHLSFFAEGLLAGTALAQGKFNDATVLFRSATAYRRNYRPGWRYLIALHAHDRDWDAAQAAKESLQKVEPSFSVEQLMEDKEYPVSLLRSNSAIALKNVYQIS